MESAQQQPLSQEKTTGLWHSVTRGSKAREGAIWAAAVTVFWAVIIGALTLETGFGLAIDFAFAFVLAVLGIPIFTLLAVGALFLLSRLPRLASGFFLAAMMFIGLLWTDLAGYLAPEGYYISAVLLCIEGLLGASLAVSWNSRNGRRWLRFAILAICIATNLGIASLLHSDGVKSELFSLKKIVANSPAPLTLPNPAARGPFTVKTLYYGSGDSLRRPEFGPSVAIKTKTVDASPFFKDFAGWKANIRKRLWGFGMDKLPLNAQVWYPDGAGPFPLVLMVHGNHNMSTPSDLGYAYLGNLLASRGFIFVSLDENFLNSGLFHDPPKQQVARAWMMLEHLKLWSQWVREPGNLFQNKVDMNNIALAGHSRGGEAAATAALFNTLPYYPDDATIPFHYGFNIKSVIAIAPVDGQYKPAEQDRVLKDINYLTIQGANDSDLSTFMGSWQWDHVQFSGNTSAFKSELYIYRANHGQFNTTWGQTDKSAPSSWLLNLRPLLTGEQQRQIAQVYISAFLEATLHHRDEYSDLFRDYRRGRAWLPDTLYVNRYADDRQETICNFGEDSDVTTTTAPGGHIDAKGLALWREGRIPIRDGTRDYNGVFIGWNWEGKKADSGDKPFYAFTLPSNSPPRESLLLSIAVGDDSVDVGSETTDFSIQASTSDGVTAKVPLSRFVTLLPPLPAKFMKWDWLDKRLYKNPSEPVFQTAIIPLNSFTAENRAFDSARLRRVQLLFDKTPSRSIIVSFIGFERGR